MSLWQQRVAAATVGNGTEEAPAVDVAAMRARVRDAVIGQGAGEMSREELIQRVRLIVDRESAGLPELGKRALADELVQDMVGFGPIEPLLEDPSVTEIMVNAPDDVWVERDNELCKVDETRFRDDRHVRDTVEKIVGRLGRRIDEASPIVDARLPDGSRINAVIPPIGLGGTKVTIRKFRRNLALKDLLAFGTLTEEVAEYLRTVVRARKNVAVTGNTGSGKTTLLNIVAAFIPANERIVTIEDAAELSLQQPHVVRLEARPPNMEGKGAVTIRDLVRNALRMRPDRIVVGEVRGGEALDMLQAMNTGHDGSLTTWHANSAEDAIARIETMALMAGEKLPVEAIRNQIVAALDVIVHTERSGGRRRIVEVADVSKGRDAQVRLRPVWKLQGDRLVAVSGKEG